MNLEVKMGPAVAEAISSLYGTELPESQFNFQKTRKEFAGDITLVTFPLLRVSKKKPEETGEEIGAFLTEKHDWISGYNVVKGFLNLELSDELWLDFFAEQASDPSFGLVAPDDSAPAVMVEYSSPNTNKPLHLGHIRNCLLGYSVAELYKAAGKRVLKVQIINDRGIHICKSMLAWQKFGEGETPESAGIKGDHLVGKYYVRFDQEYRAEVAELVAGGMEEDEAKKKAPLLLEAQGMLRAWEQGDSEVTALWEQMNSWVYTGFDATYDRLGVDFDQNYYESETYKLGKSLVDEGLSKGVFYKREDGSVWCDLTEDGLDEKLLLRADGTAVYMTQDLGTAVQRFEDYDIDQLIYTVGNEQDYHFKVLFLILGKLGYDRAKELYHLSYGMVDLPHGKMKSREGTVVDADDLMSSMGNEAKAIAEELGKLEGLNDEDKEELYHNIGMGALKYFILKVDPQKRMMFDPQESIDFNGHTGPFIQYAHARIQSLLRRADEGLHRPVRVRELHASEKEVLKLLADYPQVVQQAATEMSPAHMANYTYELVKAYNGFYQQVSIFNAETEEQMAFRVQLSKFVGHVIKSSMKTLGITVPDQM
ncbi:MAG: arginine--tRNA ligase [Flavobacteriales bacterium]|nr:arginine--tRNA ligase [Flavobacteriales bacterium]